MFHSDGNLNPLLDGAVETGKRLGVVAIWFSLKGYTTPSLRILDNAERRIMTGSGTELSNEVPQENYLGPLAGRFAGESKSLSNILPFIPVPAPFEFALSASDRASTS